MKQADTIAFEHLTVRYRTAAHAKDAAVADISLTVPQGTVCALIGPSGCGKSTLLRAVAGLVKPESGCVTIAGGKADPKKYCIGFMPQNYGLLPWQTVRENIVLGCRIRHEWHDGRAEDEARLAKLMTALHIEELASRYPHELSGGQQQRVSLARAFLLRPDILLMDEPFSALDAITREEMQDVFLALWQEQHVTTLLVTHYVEEALYLGQEIALMAADPGRIARVFANPLGGCPEKRGSQAFFEMSRALREDIRAISAARAGEEGRS
ncbi:ABC transporter ATP-binding protein [Mitsuokella jalaludinii]|uniref:ABC transporter ATP-binding protein n=1 Tax=Mitsuokella jalaludinii TaxID=187979 RepID=UPI003F8BCFD1